MSDLIERINDIVADHLPEEPRYYKQSKFINDPIWGIIELYDYELSIIDTPLFQRLRYIHQTGFTYFTYPTAHHTRFEHSLGVVNIANRILTVLNNKTELTQYDTTLRRVRLAALLHDIGHSAFSHTTEEFYSELEDIKNYLATNATLKSKGAGEAFSHLIVSSQAFKAFFKKLQDGYDDKLNNVDIDVVSNLIIAKPLTKEEFGFEADIISGPIDADKLDYFPRDGRAAGLDISLDIHRLINCVEIQETNVAGSKRKSLVVNKRGYNALQQLLFARATLTASVYHHHKVRACDNMLKNAMKAYNDEDVNFNVCVRHPEGISLKQAPNFLYITDNNVIYETNLLKRDSIRYKLLNDLFNRNLFKRVLRISLQTVVTEDDKKDSTRFNIIKSAFGEFFNLKSKPDIKERLIKEILKDSTLSDLDIHEVALDIPKQPSFEKAGDAPINNSTTIAKPDIVTLKEIIPINDWILGYERHFGNAYIFGPCNKEQRVKLAIASAKTLNKFQPDSKLPGFNFKLTYDAIADDIRAEVKKQTESTGLFRENQ